MIEIVTVELDREAEDQRGTSVKASTPSETKVDADHKTAPAPPAARAPVFPHALPVTESLKAAIPYAALDEAVTVPKDLLRKCLTHTPDLSSLCLQFVKNLEQHRVFRADALGNRPLPTRLVS